MTERHKIDDFRKAEIRIDVDGFLDKLPHKKRQVAELCKEGLTQIEIANTLNITQGRVSQIIKEIGEDYESLYLWVS